jgi:hypothetical protein
MNNKLQMLLWAVILFVGIMLAWTLRLEASETRYLTEEVCEDPAGCPIVEGKCVTCVSRSLAFVTPMVKKYVSNTKILNHTEELSHDSDGIEHDHSCEHCCFHRIVDWK